MGPPPRGNRAGSQRQSPSVGEPHGVGHEGFKTQQLAKRGAVQDVRLPRLVAAHVKIEIVGQGRVGLIRGQGRQELFQNETVQGVTAIVDIPLIAADKGRRRQEGFSGGDVGLEIRRQSRRCSSNRVGFVEVVLA